jgi:radical SAM superfamily enzyme YgiQ (UPF0313 family)
MSTTFLLVYPEIPDTYWSYKYALPFVGKRALMPPLGLAAADLVLASAMIVQADSLRALVRRCARAGTPVAVGGPYATSCPDDLGGADYLVLGEGEVTFPRFLADFLRSRAPPLRVLRTSIDHGESGPEDRSARHEVVRHDSVPILARMPVRLRVP